MMSGLFPGSLIIVAAVVIVAAQCLSKRSVIKNRSPIDLDELYQSEGASLTSHDVFRDVMQAVGKAFRIDPRLLRPSDPLKKLYDLDSWDIGEGAEQLSEWLEKECGITCFEKEPKTIIELMVAVKSAKQKSPLH